MSLVFHLLKKDLRRFWLPLCVLAAYLLVHAAVLMRQRLPSIPAAAVLQPLHLELIIFVFLVLLIWDEPSGGTSAFWRTRPISRWSLLAAKGSFILIFFVVMPVAANLLVLLYLGLEPARVAASLLEMLAPHLAVIGLGASVAAVATDLRSMAAAVGIALILLLAANNLSWFPVPDYGWVAAIVSELLVFAVTLTVLLHQYLTRKTRRSIVILGTGLLTIFFLFRLNPYGSLGQVLPWVTSGNPSGAPIEVSFAARAGRSLFYSSSQNHRGEFGTQPRIVGAFDVRNIPPSRAVMLTTLECRLEYPDGTRIAFVNRYPHFYGDTLRTLLPGFTGLSSDSSTDLLDILSPSEEEYDKMRSRTGTLFAEARFGLYRDFVAGEIPLVPRAYLEAGSTLVHVSNVELFPDNRLAAWYECRRIGSSSDQSYGPFFRILNRSRREVLASNSTSRSGSMRFPTLLWGSNISHELMEEKLQGYETSPVGDSWLAGATLLVIDRVSQGWFSRSFQVADFRLEDFTKERWVERMRAGK